MGEPTSLERAVAFLSHQGGHGKIGLELGLRERHLGEFRTLPVFQRLDGVIKSLDPDPAIRPFQTCQDRRQRVERVGDGAAVGARVQVAIGSLNVELEVSQPLQAVGDCRHPGGKLAACRR